MDVPPPAEGAIGCSPHPLRNADSRAQPRETRIRLKKQKLEKRNKAMFARLTVVLLMVLVTASSGFSQKKEQKDPVDKVSVYVFTTELGPDGFKDSKAA